MKGQTIISLHDKYILVNVKGDPLSPKEIEDTITKAVTQATQSNLNIIIFRETPVKQKATTVDFYYYAESLNKSNFRRKLALVFPKEMHHDNLDFFETACINRGINLRLFAAQNDGLKWLND